LFLFSYFSTKNDRFNWSVRQTVGHQLVSWSKVRPVGSVGQIFFLMNTILRFFFFQKRSLPLKKKKKNAQTIQATYE
jgi:hypothetical protein